MTHPSKSERRQRQDSLHDQLQSVIGLAESAGCYDAADWIKRTWWKPCPECNGLGTVTRSRRDGSGDLASVSVWSAECPSCNGRRRAA